MRILHILNSNIYSGAENVVCTIMKNKRPGDECLYLSREGDIRAKLKELGLSFCGVKKLDRSTIKSVVLSFQPDIIHAHDFTASIAAVGLMCKGFVTPEKKPIPVISHLHNNRPWMKKLTPRTILYAATFNRYAAVLQVSDSIGREYVFSNGQGKRMLTVGNPFSAKAVRQMAIESGNLAGAASDDRISAGGVSAEGAKNTDILFVGRLTEQKNLPCFIETVGLVRKELPDIQASIVGTGELDKLCHDLINAAGLENTISMEGYSDNPYSWMKSSRLLVMPSLYEGFGLVALEAMSLGVPVLACPVGGLAEIVTSECGAFCYTPGEFAQKITELLGDEKKYAAMSEAARARADEYDNVDEYMQKLYRVYRNVSFL